MPVGRLAPHCGQSRKPGWFCLLHFGQCQDEEAFGCMGEFFLRHAVDCKVEDRAYKKQRAAKKQKARYCLLSTFPDAYGMKLLLFLQRGIQGNVAAWIQRHRAFPEREA